MAKGRRIIAGGEGPATADRVLTLLTCFQDGDDGLTLAELAHRTKITKSTVLRLASSLQAHRFLLRAEDGLYRLAPEVLRLGMIYRNSFKLEIYVVPVLEELEARFMESVSFYTQRETQRICLHRVDSSHSLRYHVREGDMLPMDLSATSQVLRIFGKKPLPAFVSSIELPIHTSGSTDPLAASLSTPVFGPEGLIGCLTVSGPSARITSEVVDRMKPILKAAGAKLSVALGGGVSVYGES